jgi:hypothetical protein
MTTTLNAEVGAAKVASVQTRKLIIKRALKQQEDAMEQENYIPVRWVPLAWIGVS